MKRKLIFCLLLAFSLFADSISCVAKTEDWEWENIRGYWLLGNREWTTGRNYVRELTSDDIGKAPENTYVVPDGQEILVREDFPYDIPYEQEYTEIKLPQSLKIIEGGAFSGLCFLRTITIPSGVTEVGGNIFYGCANLQTIINKSSQTIPLPNYSTYGYYPASVLTGSFRLEYYVDGEKVTEVPPGKVAVAKGKEYSLTYNLNGGKMAGEALKTYCYGEQETKLPNAKRKGYTFLGWSFNKESTGYKTWFSLYNENGMIVGDRTLTARWKKIRVKKSGKNGIQIREYDRNYDDDWAIACLYSTKKNMKDAKIICLEQSFSTKKKKGVILGDKTKNYAANYYPKKKLLTVDLKKLKKGKTYYLQFRRINGRSPYLYINKKALKTVKVKL